MKVSFGFTQVEPEEKTKLVKKVFASVADSYDKMNDVMSLGVHRLWKKALVNQLNLSPNSHHLDLAGGTGDISFKILEQYPETKITLCDINEEMLRVGQSRCKSHHVGKIEWVCGDAAHLPFSDNVFDCYTIAFGLRNVTEMQSAINEAYRVLKPGSRYFCLEFSKVVLPLIDEIYEQYSFKVIPKMGELVANDKESYQYLVESIVKFPSQLELEEMLRIAGFERVRHENLSGGIVAIHSGWKV